MFTCRVCGAASEPSAYILFELMYGTREPFNYFLCNDCGCLQIGEIPADMAPYYGDGYYSLKPATVASRQDFRRWLKARQIQSTLSRSSLVGAAANALLGEPEIADWFRHSGCGFDARILDVGCGNGRLLLQLQALGFGNLEGIDPFLEGDIRYSNGLTIRKKSINDVTAKYDLVMMHHSFEHVPDPVATLEMAARITDRNGCILIRVPLVDSEAWEVYKENWVQLDAPRHLHLFSRKSIRILARRCELEVVAEFDDSHAMQFWASEQYKRGISLRDPRSLMSGSEASIFNKAEIRAFGKRARSLNKSKRGDQGCFVLRLRA